MENLSTNICPYLGMRDDSTTPVGYPSTRNVCYHSKKQEIPNLNYQRLTCLRGRFERCPLYSSENIQWMPRSIRYRSGKSFVFSRSFIYIALITLVVIAVFILVFYSQWTPNVSQLLIPSWQKTQHVRTIQPLPTYTLSLISTEETDGNIEPTQTATFTITPEPTKTATKTMAPLTLAMDTPIGADVQFIIHRALVGESLFQYAREYDTNVDAIAAVNYDLSSVLYVGTIVVIPVGVDDPGGLPSFETFQVTMRGLTVDTMAEELSADPESLSKYNNVPMDYTFNPGEWILVPRE